MFNSQAMQLSQQDREDLVYGLQMRICYIETETATLRASDAINMGKANLVRALSQSQREVIARHEALIKKLLTAPFTR